MRNPLTLVLVIAAAVGTLALDDGRARADVAPPDSCTSPGQPCQNAGPQYDSPGTCLTATCTRQVPAPDGGTMSMDYDCNRCTANGGAGGNGAGGGGGSMKSGSSGCSVAPTHGRSDAATAILLIGTLLLTARRRRTLIG
jgi:MYXO-CTERM domain-containing protein